MKTQNPTPHVIEIALVLYSVRLPMYQPPVDRDTDASLLAMCMSDANALIRATEGEPVKH